MFSNVWKQVVGMRGIRHKANPKNYPQINIEDVILDKQRFGFRKIRPPLLSQSVRDSIFPSEDIKKLYIQEGKAVPIKHRSHSDEISRRNYERYADEIANGKPHFRVGDKEIYLPKATICLLRPNAKHTPYQAKFLVPRNFNKMDLRDYLWHIYGLRALNITVQLLHAKFERGMNDLGRYRGTQFKKMTVDMEEPFIWPSLAPEAKTYKHNIRNQTEVVESRNGVGSDKNKPSNAFNGLYNKPTLPNKFVSKEFKKQATAKLNLHNQRVQRKSDLDLVTKYANQL